MTELQRDIRWQCSTCTKVLRTKEACEQHILNTHSRSGKGGQPLRIDMTPDYSDAAWALGPNFYGR